MNGKITRLPTQRQKIRVAKEIRELRLSIIFDAIYVLWNKDWNPHSNYVLKLNITKKTIAFKAMVLRFISNSREISFRHDDCSSHKSWALLPIGVTTLYNEN